MEVRAVPLPQVVLDGCEDLSADCSAHLTKGGRQAEESAPALSHSASASYELSDGCGPDRCGVRPTLSKVTPYHTRKMNCTHSALVRSVMFPGP